MATRLTNLALQPRHKHQIQYHLFPQYLRLKSLFVCSDQQIYVNDLLIHTLNMSGVSKVPASQAKVSAAPQPSRRLSRRENTKPKRGGTTTKKPSRTRKLFIFWTISSTVLFAVTSWFAGSTFSTRPGNQVNHILQYYFRISFGKTVAVLRVLQGITSACTSIAVSSSFETVQWELVNRREGLGLLNILSLSPATGAFGVFQLIFGRKENVGNRLCAILR